LAAAFLLCEVLRLSLHRAVHHGKFTGYEADDETGLNFAQARFQSSVQGRFTSADPLSGNPHRPQSWNRYAYVLNNPLKLVDPTGMSAVRSTDDSSVDVRAHGDGALSLGESWTRDEALEDAAEATKSESISGIAGIVGGVAAMAFGAGVDAQENALPQDLVNSGTAAAARRLIIEPCGAFFGGTAKGLKALRGLKFTADPFMDESGHPQAQLQANGVDVKVNTNYVGPDGGGGVTPNTVNHDFILVDPVKGTIRVLTLRGVEAREFVQLHEVAHNARRFGKTDYDGDKQHIMNAYRNNFKLWQGCFGGVPTQPWTGKPPFMH
jgi:RHS repeat-associated protein